MREWEITRWEDGRLVTYVIEAVSAFDALTLCVWGSNDPSIISVVEKPEVRT